MKNTTLTIILALIFSSMVVRAQRAEQYVQQLSDSRPGVKIYLSSHVAKALEAAPQIERISGFRVCVFSDNSQSARSSATAASSTLGEMIGSGNVNMIYDNPFFRVYGGYCINKTEATQLLGRIKGAFPKAFILPMSFPIENLSIQNNSPSDSTQNSIVEREVLAIE